MTRWRRIWGVYFGLVEYLINCMCFAMIGSNSFLCSALVSPLCSARSGFSSLSAAALHSHPPSLTVALPLLPSRPDLTLWFVSPSSSLSLALSLPRPVALCPPRPARTWDCSSPAVLYPLQRSRRTFQLLCPFDPMHYITKCESPICHTHRSPYTTHDKIYYKSSTNQRTWESPNIYWLKYTVKSRDLPNPVWYHLQFPLYLRIISIALI